MKKRTLLLTICLWMLVNCIVCAQTTPDSSGRINVLTADSLASGNYKDVLTSFFQLAFNNITGPQKELAFASNPFAIMLRGNRSLSVDTNYIRYKHLRDLNFNVSLKLDSQYRLNEFSVGVKYALINKRDITVAKDFIIQSKNSKVNDEFAKLTESISIEGSDPRYSDAFLDSAILQTHRWETSPSTRFCDMDRDVQKFVLKIIKEQKLIRLQTIINANPKFNFYSENQKSFLRLKEEFQNKPLWTIAGFVNIKSAPTDNRLFVSNALFLSEFLVGLNSPNNRVKLELDLRLSDSLNSDVSAPEGNVRRNIATGTPGVNFVFKSRDLQRSVFEFKISGSYNYLLSSPQNLYDKEISTLNGELRIRIFQDIWIPVLVRLDEHGRVYGSFNAKINFASLAQMFG